MAAGSWQMAGGDAGDGERAVMAMAGGRWQMAGGRWRCGRCMGRWQMAGGDGRWQMADGRGHLSGIPQDRLITLTIKTDNTALHLRQRSDSKDTGHHQLQWLL
jgi:hypothetical protein